MKRSTTLLALAVAAGAAVSAAPYPQGPTHASDVGPAAAFAENARVTVTVALRLRNADQLESLIQSVYTAGSPQYRQFLSPEEFRSQFGPSAASLAAVTRQFEAQGLTVTQSATAQLHVTGSAAQIEKAFAVELHSFEVAATATTSAYRYRAPLAAPHIPAAIAGEIRAVLGLDSRPRMAPRLRRPVHLPLQTGRASANSATKAPNTTDPPGLWTVVDYAEYYDVNPLYHQGVTGKGRTIAIVTLASFTPSDAYKYWSVLGLKVHPDRIREVQIDGGSGPPSDESGSDETTLDVEQSGGLAPAARIIVYEAPNTSQGFIDAFAAAIDSNKADTVSTSWGEWEGFDGPNLVVDSLAESGLVTNPANGELSTIVEANNDLLAQAALQGQTWFAASGDYGAYDSVNSLPLAPSEGQPYSYNAVLSVDDPGMQRYITAAGGTTLPGPQDYTGPTGAPIVINVAEERAWGWDYLAPLCNAFGQNAVECGTYPIGSGGGVSIYVRRPFYQWAVPGMVSTVPGQALSQLTPPPAQLLYPLPADFRGRNVPDLSTNADPQTGYVIYYTSNVNGFEIEQAGGTSFVAPELNGVATLFVDALHHRIGLLNPALYAIAGTPGAYHGQRAPLRAVTRGDNWYWHAHAGFNQATGVGIPDVANLLEALEALER
jgi:kumamolisin